MPCADPVGGVFPGHSGGRGVCRPAEVPRRTGTVGAAVRFGADRRDAELGVRVGTEARPSVGVRVGAGPGSARL